VLTRPFSPVYDVLHGFRAGINVAAPATSPHGNDNPFAMDNISHSPTTFIQGMAAAYKASGRTQRIFDTVVHHPYGDNNAERPYEMHPGPYFIGAGGWNKLVATYQQARAPQAVLTVAVRPMRPDLVPRGRLPDPASADRSSASAGECRRS
jgi:hypothetical protein